MDKPSVVGEAASCLLAGREGSRHSVRGGEEVEDEVEADHEDKGIPSIRGVGEEESATSPSRNAPG